MLRASARGLLDFSDYSPWDTNWWRRSHMLLRAMDREDDRHLIEARLAHYGAMLIGHLSNPQLATGVKDAHAASIGGLNDMVNWLQPWDPRTLEDVQQGHLKGLEDSYRDWVGDPADPEFQKLVEEDVRRIKDAGLEVDPGQTEERELAELEERFRRRTRMTDRPAARAGWDRAFRNRKTRR